MRKCIATVSLSGTLSEKLDAIAAARFDAIEVFENDLIHFQGSPQHLREMATDRGLGIDLYQPFRDLDAATDEQFRRNLDRAERKFDIMEMLGAPMMLVCSNATPGAVTDDARIAAQFNALADRAARRNLRIAFEALAWGRHVNRYRHVWSIVKAADHPHLGVALDTFHTLSLGDDPAGIAEIPGDKIFFLQLADAPRLAMDVLQWSRHYRCFPGQGQFDLARFLEYLLIAGYTGPLSLEIFNDVFREAPGRRTAIDAMQSLLYLESQTRQRLTTAAAANPQSPASHALGRVALFDPPQPPRLDGVAFLEFAVDKKNETALGGFLESLGFALAGRHRSKEVSLYQQGDINLVLNAEPDSFARAHFVEHGPSICAMSVTTDDSVRALNRATALNCPRFDSRIGPHELKIPAIRSPDGSLIYFVPAQLGSDGLYEIDFDLRPRPRLQGIDAGLTSIDHVAIGLPVEALDTWILFYRAVLGMQPGDSLELSDPYGLIRSCGVASDNRSVRVVLNVSQSRSTLTARTVTSHGGASVHHIAFAAADIFVTMEKLAANGARFVPISGNYYDDLLARFDLPTAEVERMRRHNVLYERSEGGEYFHAYSEPFAGRFFFEIIQRTGDYDGYGALNAAARIASQVQHVATTAHP
jgi:4-hydroxyphenylpyruvate dioxygenase